MLLIPMDDPDSTPCIVRCVRCSKHEQSANAYADIKGEPYKAFYCSTCTAILKTHEEAPVMTREEFFARLENAHV